MYRYQLSSGVPTVFPLRTHLHRRPLSRMFRYVVFLQPTVAGINNGLFFSAVHTIRIHGIYEKNRSVLFGMSGLLALQIVTTAVCCAFYRCECRSLRRS
jgi:hypothetical protein